MSNSAQPVQPLSQPVFGQQPGDPIAQFIDVTPEIALGFLSHNEGNRDLRQGKIDLYAGQMRKGTFKPLNGESVSIDWLGNVHNGQHRFHGIVASGITQRMLVVTNVDPATFVTVDDVARRSASDAFGHGQFSRFEATHLPVAVKLEIAMRLGAKTFQTPSYISHLTTSAELLKIAENDTSFASTLNYLKGFVKARRDVLSFGNATCLARRMFLCDVNQNRAGFTEEWLPGLFTGMDISGPRYLVRERIRKAEISDESISQSDRMAMVAKAWWSDKRKRPQATLSSYLPRTIVHPTKWLELPDDDMQGLAKIRKTINARKKVDPPLPPEIPKRTPSED